MIEFVFHFSPADGSPVREIRACIKVTDGQFLSVSIDWGPDQVFEDHPKWMDPPLFGLEGAARFIAKRILGRVEIWGGGTVVPLVQEPVPYDFSKIEPGT